MIIDSKIKSIRSKLRKQSKNIIDYIVTNYISQNIKKDNLKVAKEICNFCGSIETITKEHVLPRWTFENCTKRFFITEVNNLQQTYINTTIPVCSDCNNNLLGYLEKYIINSFKTTDLNKICFSSEQNQNIIRWLEIIEYKFHVLEARRKFLSHKKAGYISFLKDFPITVMRKSIDYSPAKAVSQIRLAQKRIAIKAKTKNENSLVVFRTKNENFYFFHQMDEFIFLELSEFKVAVFYFYNRLFEQEVDAYNQAMKIIKEVY
jgi:hypothetical protein